MRKQEIIASSARTTPNPPVIISATDVGLNRAFNDAQIDVVVSAPFDGKLPITSYTAVSTPGSITANNASTTIPVPGLTSATSYTFVARATNAIGPSSNSSSSGSVLATTVPQNPTIGTASNVNGIAFASNPNLTISFTAGATGGKTISSYRYSTNGGTTFANASGTTSPITLTTQSTGTAFAAGTDYNVILRAVNANGESTSSGTSNNARAATVPQTPTIGTASRVSNTVARVVWTPNNNGGTALTQVLVESSPSISLTYTNTDVDGSVDVTGSFVQGTSYTFRVRSTNAAGNSAFSAFSNSIIVNPVPAPNFPVPNFPQPNFPQPNFPTPNFPVPDFTPNFPTPNFPTPNFPTPNFPTPNFPTPNFPTPNFPVPSFVPVPNFPTPNFPTPNFPTPNFPTPNFPVFCDCYSPCCCGGVPGCCGGTWFC